MTEIMDIIECALALAGLDIAEVGDDYLLVRDAGRDESFGLELSRTGVALDSWRATRPDTET